MLVEQDEQRKGCLVCEDLVREAGRTKVMLMGQVIMGLKDQETEAGLHSTEEKQRPGSRRSPGLFRRPSILTLFDFLSPRH